MTDAQNQNGGSEEMILTFLAEAGDEFISGEAISDKLGFTRTAVWKHVEGLRGQGYRIDASPARGYRLVEVPDRLGPLEVRPLLATRDLGQTLHFYEEIDSTNDRAKELAEDGAVHGEAVIAELQRAGRGRRGRTWSSPAGRNLYLSVVLRPELPPTRAPELTLVAALAVCDALRKAGVDAGIKWPNDVMAGGKKIAGILTELSAEPDHVHWVVLGVGVNLNARREDFPAALRDEATSVLIERGQAAPRALFTAALLLSLEQWLDVHQDEGFDAIREAWRTRSVTLGRTVMVRMGDRDIEGVAEDLDASGALLVRTSSGVERVMTGDVVLLRPR
jgi:BirA family biotin operon repressor/biotin-[acetyl-CoA-carboxylase] ligase